MNDTERNIAEFFARKCLEKKAENVLILDLENRSSIADFFVICSGHSDRQVASIAEHVAKEAKAIGLKPTSQEGLSDGRWALLDFSTVIVHVFQDSLRDYYNLESLWHDAPRIRLKDPADQAIKVQIQYGSTSHQGHSQI